MMIERTITQLLKSHTRVILPGFGAIIKKADFSEEVFFNQFIKLDDGLLRNQLVIMEGLSEDEAALRIQDFIHQVVQDIRMLGSVCVGDLGNFCIVEGRVELVKDKKMITPVAPSLPGENQQAEEDWSMNQIASTLQAEQSAGLATGDLSKRLDAVVNETPPDARPADSFNLSEIIRYKGVAWIMLPLLFVAMGVGVITYSSRTGQHVYSPPLPDRGKHRVTAADAADTNRFKSGAEHRQSLIEIPRHGDTPPGAAARETMYRYHVIVGAFSIEANADKMIRELQDSNVVAHKIPLITKGMFLVSKAEFGDLPAALAGCRQVKARYPGVWIAKFSDDISSIH